MYFELKLNVDRFPSLVPSLAVVLCTATDVHSLVTLQRQFKNSLAIFLDYSDYEWIQMQVKVPGGNLRLLRCSSNVDDMVQVIIQYFDSMKDRDKLSLQSKYFLQLESSLTLPAAAKSILHDSLTRINVSSHEVVLMQEGMTTLAAVIDASSAGLQSCCPIDIKSISAVCSLFE